MFGASLLPQTLSHFRRAAAENTANGCFSWVDISPVVCAGHMARAVWRTPALSGGKLLNQVWRPRRNHAEAQKRSHQREDRCLLPSMKTSGRHDHPGRFAFEFALQPPTGPSCKYCHRRCSSKSRPSLDGFFPQFPSRTPSTALPATKAEFKTEAQRRGRSVHRLGHRWLVVSCLRVQDPGAMKGSWCPLHRLPSFSRLVGAEQLTESV